ncbi:SCO7613 C-terminal domain-containing membrane protein [Actinomadura parmotrematis]|uniref:DUF2157 domain-containing protein n=1 Tax=Actinomadura parmotrematis TaxID=2864039 RepID=A0ABS7FRS9_9ACTN|nr:hypothetical protein [Actinomadura parmotrematis]MBW8483107.1 hypothetical protein [Actinomadura parmotrematis]
MTPPCPGCRAPLPVPPEPACPRCGLALTGPGAAELWDLDRHLARLAEQRLDLLRRLYRSGPAEAAPAPPYAHEGPRTPEPARREVSRAGARTVLLAAGVLLTGLAALVFALVSWGTLGIAGRTAVLASLTVLALGAARPLARRGLPATAEAAAFVGLLLLAVDCAAAYGADLAGLRSLDAAWYATGASLLVAALWAGYGRIAPVRSAAPTTVVLAQVPPLLALVACDVPLATSALTLLLLSLLDLGVREAARGGRRAAVRGAATAAGMVALLAGTGVALGTAYLAAPSAFRFAGALAVAAAVTLVWAARLERLAGVLSGVTAAAALTAAVPAPRHALPLVLAVAAVLTAVAARPLSARLRRPVYAGTGLMLLVALIPERPDLWNRFVWPLPLAIGNDYVAGTYIPFLTLLVAGTGLVLFRPRALVPPVVLLLAMSVPVLPYEGMLATVFAALAALALWRNSTPAGVTVLAGSAWLAAACLGTDATTLAVLGSLALSAAAYAVAVRARRSAATTLAVLAVAAVVAATGDVAGVSARWTAFGVLAVAALAAALAATAVRSPAVEAAGWTAAAAAVAMAVPHWGATSTLLGLAGALALATALRPDRRQGGYAGAVLLGAAWWLRLATASVDVPEAYAVPVAAALLVVGAMRRRRDPGVPSWTAYGPALASALVPSLLAAWARDGAVRPLLLAVAAAAVMLAGAHHRLRAPLLAGAAVLLLDALRYLLPLLGHLPGWLPLAAIGLLALGAGATYEARLRDLRRMRAAVGRMA